MPPVTLFTPQAFQAHTSHVTLGEFMGAFWHVQEEVKDGN